MRTVLILLIGLGICVAGAMLATRWGRALRRGAGFALMVLGIGVILDPPARHGVESVDGDRDGGETERGGADGRDLP